MLLFWNYGLVDNKIKMIVNPAAGNGKAGKSWAFNLEQSRKILGDVAYHCTSKPGEATSICRNALRDGFTTIVAVGGDGTISEVVNGFFIDDRTISAEAKLGIIPMGTGGDFAKTLATPDDLDEMLLDIKSANTFNCDIGYLECSRKNNTPISRYFINIADAGFGGAVAERVNNTSKALGPFFVYLTGLMQTLAVYKNRPFLIQIDEQDEKEIVAAAVVIANGQFFGGGMWAAPQAKLADGMFKIVIIGDISKTEILKNIQNLYNGTLCNHPKVKSFGGKKIRLAASAETIIETDGEVAGKLPATFEIRPAAIELICPRKK